MNSQAIMAFVRLFAGLIVAGATLIGVSLDVDIVVQAIMIVITAVYFIHQWWWKNQNVTTAAQAAQQFKDNLILMQDEVVNEEAEG